MRALARNARTESWCFVTRKHIPAAGGMERLSHEVTTRISQRHTTTLMLLPPSRWRLPLALARAAVALWLQCAARRIALVHVGDPVLAPLALVARAWRVPVAVTLHGLDVVHDTPAYRWWRRLFLRRFDAYICISEATRGAALRAGMPADRLVVIRIGIDVAQATADAVVRDPDRLLFVGRLVRRKGLAWFVKEVLPALTARRPDLRLVVLGDGPERGTVVAAARDAGVADRLVWPEKRDERTKAAWLDRAALCILPNVAVRGDIEGFGIVALEAAAAGCPVVAADLEGLREAVADGRSGTLVRSGDARAWIRAIDERLDDPAATRRAGVRAQRYVRQACGWTGIIDEYERLFTALTRGDRASFVPR